MIFYRYQNTKTLERHSFEYIDMNMLYERATTYIYCRSEEEFNIDNLLNFLRGHCFELQYRQNLTEDKYDDILKEIINIVLKHYNRYATKEEEKKNRKNAWDEITLLMKPYPLKGLFVIPEHSEEFEHGTKYSKTELRSNIITGLSSSSAKYLAVYEGDVICDEMNYGGTLIKPTKLVEVLDLYEEVDGTVGVRYDFYRDILDDEELEYSIKYTKKRLKRYIECDFDDLIEHRIKVHTRELLIRELLIHTNANYKQLEYRNLNNKHYVAISKDNKEFNFSIPEENITAENLLRGDTIIHNGELSITDLITNTSNKKTFELKLIV